MDFLKIECDGDAGLIAMGDGMTIEKGEGTLLV